MSTRTGHRRASSSEVVPAGGRPVLLATLGVPLDESAIAFAIDTAVETGGSLIVVNVTRLEPLALSVRLGYDALEEYTPEVSESLRKTTSSAVSMGPSSRCL